MATAVATDAFEFVEQRGQLIEDALHFVQTTRQLDAEYGREEESRTRKLESIEDALGETDLKIVVIGEFSRGKSTLLNALLGDQILPTANNQTTAINTFIYGIEDDRSPYIEIIYQDGRREELEWSQGVIERWGTELNRENRDARKEVEKIHAYSDHPLLQNNLVLIDTPGFEGILPRHEEIAKDAMNDAHVAVWLQSAEQLGGNAREWEFLQDSIARNFHKFLTVINKWDLVLNPQDPQERKKPREQRTEEALDRVRSNFFDYCEEGLEREEIERLTDEDNLMGVSAIWGLYDEPEKVEASNITKVAERIERMCRTGEAEKEMLAGPLHSLQDVQQDLEATIQDERRTIDDSDDLEEFQSEIDTLSHELERLKHESERKLQDARIEHDVYANEFKDKVRSKLKEPLELLKQKVESHIDQDRILRKLEAGDDSIGLPEEVHAEFDETLLEINQRWSSIREDLEQTLKDLASSFQSEMSDVASDITGRMAGGSIELGELSVDMDVDLSKFEEHQQKRSELKTKLEEKRSELESTREEKNPAELERLKARKEEARRQARMYERQLDNLGPTPSPKKKTVTKEEKRGGFFGTIADVVKGPKEVSKTITDASNVHRHNRRKRKLERSQREKDKRVNELIDKYAEEKNRQLSREQAEARYEREIEKLEFQLKKDQEELKQDMRREAERLAKSLHNQTTRRLSEQERQLREDVPSAIEDLFDHHLEQLEEAVQEQYREPMETKRSMLSDTKELMEQEETEIEAKKEQLQSLQENIETLQRNTRALLEQINDIYVD